MQIIIRLTLAVVAAGISLALSWPYQRDFEYWAESQGAWLLYFGLGFLLATAVFYLFFESLEVMFEHDEIARGKLAEANGEVKASAEEAS